MANIPTNYNLHVFQHLLHQQVVFSFDVFFVAVILLHLYLRVDFVMTELEAIFVKCKLVLLAGDIFDSNRSWNHGSLVCDRSSFLGPVWSANVNI